MQLEAGANQITQGVRHSANIVWQTDMVLGASQFGRISSRMSGRYGVAKQLEFQIGLDLSG